MATTDNTTTQQTEVAKSGLIYGLNDRPPLRETLFAAAQHLLAIFVAIVTPPLIIASALKLDTDTWSVKAIVENELVEATMRQEQISLMNYLRTQLRNDYITLHFEIAPNNMPRRATSRLERYKSMLQRYPALEMLRKEFDLELA